MPDDIVRLLTRSGSWVLVFAHPGHELRAYHLMERVQPAVAVLTDGSGSANTPRVTESRALLAQVGATPVEPFGSLTDRDAYAALIAAEARPFMNQVDTLTAVLTAGGVRAVVMDAAEGYNPLHDVCHWIARAAAERARQSGVDLVLLELDLIAHPDGSGDGHRLVLDDRAFARKLDAISRYGPLEHEADAAFARHGVDAFRIEFVRRVAGSPPPPPSWIPYYEEVGKARVRAGIYPSVLGYGSHVRPVIERLLAGVQPRHHAADFHPVHE